MAEKEKSLNGSNKVLSWQALGLMTFTSVWGFGNIVNGYANQGLKAVVSWILMFALYFIPYVLMVGEMGSTFKESAGGVSSPPPEPNWPTSPAGPTGSSICPIWPKSPRTCSLPLAGRYSRTAA